VHLRQRRHQAVAASLLHRLGIALLDGLDQQAVEAATGHHGAGVADISDTLTVLGTWLEQIGWE